MSAPLPVVVVTGASAGIGAAIVELLIASGNYRVALVARRPDQLQEVIGKARGTPANTLAVVADVSTRANVERVAAETVAHFGRIDVWVNNAGRGIFKKTTELDDADIDDMMRVNVLSALYGMQTALKQFRLQDGKGQIVNVSSLLGRNASIAHMRSAYAGAKHFLNAITATFRAEVAQSDPNVVVSNVSPGVIATDFGLNANGPDSRGNNATGGAQDPVDCAKHIVAVIGTTTTEAYTVPHAYKMITGYIASLGAPPAAATPSS